MDALIQYIYDVFGAITSWFAGVIAAGLSLLASALPAAWDWVDAVVDLLSSVSLVGYLMLIGHWFPLYWLSVFAGAVIAAEIALTAWWVYRLTRQALL